MSWTHSSRTSTANTAAMLYPYSPMTSTTKKALKLRKLYPLYRSTYKIWKIISTAGRTSNSIALSSSSTHPSQSKWGWKGPSAMPPMLPGNTWMKYLPERHCPSKKIRMCFCMLRRYSQKRSISIIRSNKSVCLKLRKPCCSSRLRGYLLRWVLGPASQFSLNSTTLNLSGG